MNQSRKKWLEILVYCLPVPVFFLALSLGAVSLGFQETVDIFAYRVTGGSVFETLIAPESVAVLMDVRLPRVLTAMLVGGGLAVAGAAFQSLLKNPLVEPFTLGLSSGAALGAALSMAAIITLPVSLSAFLFAALSITVCYLIAQRKGETPVISLILAGIVVSAVFTAGLYAVQLVVDPLKLQGLVFWTMGGFYTATWDKLLQVVFPMLGAFVVLFIMRWKLNVLSLGEREAKLLGVNPLSGKLIIIGAATLLAACAVSVSGIIGLVGLMIPHICRMIFGADNVKLVPLSMAMGATYLALVDLCSRTLFSFEIPVGIFTTLLGAPFFVVLLRKTRGGAWS